MSHNGTHGIIVLFLVVVDYLNLLQRLYIYARRRRVNHSVTFS